MKSAKRTVNIEAYVQWFNRLSYLVATEICMVWLWYSTLGTTVLSNHHHYHNLDVILTAANAQEGARSSDPVPDQRRQGVLQHRQLQLAHGDPVCVHVLLLVQYTIQREAFY